MPKAERGSIKDIGNRIKAKGLQKLKFYCQLCSKQCRDENGFKCHLTSDSHLRQMAIFRSNSNSILDSFSKDFESVYLQTLYRRHRTSRVHANTLYQEVIQDRDHVHMNATKWTTLSDFIQYLGKTGKCKVENDPERGWYVQFIERDPTILAQQENYQRRVDEEQREEERMKKAMERQRKEAAILLDKMGVGLDIQASSLKAGSDGNIKQVQPVGFSFSTKISDKKKKTNNCVPVKRKKLIFSNDNDVSEECNKNNVTEEIVSQIQQESKKSNPDRKRKCITNVDDAEDKLVKTIKTIKKTPWDSRNKDSVDQKLGLIRDVRKNHWIRIGILVRVISKRQIRLSKIINGTSLTTKKTKSNKKEFYQRKGKIIEVEGKYNAIVEMLDSGPEIRDGGDTITVDQDSLETVIPKVGKKVLIVNGCGRGLYAELIDVDKQKCRGTLKILNVDCDENAQDDLLLKKVDFDDFSKAS